MRESPLLRLKIPALRLGQGRELAAVGLDVKQRGAVEAVEPAHQDCVALDLLQLHDRGADRIGAHRRAQREGAAGRLVVLRTLQHEVAARLVEPVDDFQVRIKVHALDGGHPGLEDLEPADRSVMASLPRGLEPRSPWRADAANEDEPGVLCLGHLDRKLALANFVLSYHLYSSCKPRATLADYEAIANCGRSNQSQFGVIARSNATKQSRVFATALDCRVASLLAMTARATHVTPSPPYSSAQSTPHRRGGCGCRGRPLRAACRRRCAPGRMGASRGYGSSRRAGSDRDRR